MTVTEKVAEMAAEINQCAVELEEAARLMRATYPGVASLYVAAASRARAAAGKAVPSVQTRGPVNECPHCKRMFKDGETCTMGGCPMGGDF